MTGHGRHLRKQLITLYITAISVLHGCASTPSVKVNQDADILVLTPTYSVKENLGKGEAALRSNENLVRFKFERQGKDPEFLVVIYPAEVESRIEVNLSDREAEGASKQYGSYFDQLLRAHRYFLRGDLELAEAQIQRIMASYDTGYGTAVLAANIAILKGDDAKARSFLSLAERLKPGTTKDLERTDAEATP